MRPQGVGLKQDGTAGNTENEPGTEMKLADNLDPAHIKDGLRLITAFGLIEKTKRKKVVDLAESMVLIES